MQVILGGSPEVQILQDPPSSPSRSQAHSGTLPSQGHYKPSIGSLSTLPAQMLPTYLVRIRASRGFEIIKKYNSTSIHLL